MLKILIFVTSLLITLFFINFGFSQISQIYKIEGYALDVEGNPIDGNVTGIIVGTSWNNTSSVVKGFWELTFNFSDVDDAKDREFKLGIRVNTTNQTGYFFIEKFGAKSLSTKEKCRDQTWNLSTLVFYPERNVSGSIKVVLNGKIVTGNVVRGKSNIVISSCLVPGKLYPLEVEVVSGTSEGFYSTKVVGK